MTTTFASLLPILALTACGGGAVGPDTDGPAGPGTNQLPAYVVVDAGATEHQSAVLASALGLEPGDVDLRSDGALIRIDGERLNHVPMIVGGDPGTAADENGHPTKTTAERVDLDALAALRVPTDDEAIARATAAFDAAMLLPEDAEPAVGHTRFEIYDGDELTLEVELDTRVGFQRRLDGHRLMGPGAKAELTLDADGEVAGVLWASRTLERGGLVDVIAPEDALPLCADALGESAFDVTAELVYWAPSLEHDVERILPHYVCAGQILVDGSAMPARSRVVPAVLDAPRVTVEAIAVGSEVTAEATVRGGRAPYTYEWASGSGSLVDGGGPTVAYEATPRQPIEVLSLRVVDADGLEAAASARAAVPVVEPLVPGDLRSPFGTVATEWIGDCGGLAGSAGNAGGFANRFATAGIPPSFNWGEFDAWEVDFKDTDVGGQDDVMVDNVDLAFYTGHAGGDGFAFCGEANDTLLRYDDAQWGENWNLEWLVVAACGPLEDDGGAWRTRWGPAFGGLHLLMAYANTSFDNSDEGGLFAEYAVRAANPLTMVDSWSQTAQQVQPAGVTWATMGVFNAGWGAPNFSDYFWGMGSTGGDLRVPAEYWRISGDSL